MDHFLSTPAGIACLIVLAAVSLANIYSHWIEDGLWGRLLYMAVVFTCGAGLIRVFIGSEPRNVFASLVILFALTTLRNFSIRTCRRYKYRRTINAQHHKQRP